MATLQKTDRVFGLDLLRSVAILIVVVSHANPILQKSFPLFPNIPLPDGVDLFFVLSGFLIGNILIQTFENNQKIYFGKVLHFLKRRWFRTLPNYFLFLLLNILLIYFGLIAGELNRYLSTYFVFTQYFYKPFDFLFWESWSLCVEEWFYLLFPLCLLLFYSLGLKKIKWLFFFTILIFIIIPILYRYFMEVPYSHPEIYYRMLVTTRLDSIGYGLLGAFVFNYFPTFWYKFKFSFFLLGIVLMLFILSLPFSVSYYTTFYFTITGLSILFLLPQLQNLKSETIPFKPFTFISKISYAMYLVNLPLLQISRPLWSSLSVKLEPLAYLIYWLVLILVSSFVYRNFEKPIMDLRDKIS